ncbi:hypothetical protein M9194_07640 [Vibrio sp. S4M6]|uniref:transporter substrate-binding domain-containing protein n=1 Tax=Vibrio sinus TaxID=2946865 RepID=UPI00202A199C|nr:transporter substrate-binding domain-containing protein [Vibrio sinus]MCL9781300.1 hypothetical protein [Vibrio sinus]
MSQHGILLFVAILSMISYTSHACNIVMGFKTESKTPLIGSLENNDGYYRDLYSLAALKIGCRLTIKRLPKKRILLEMRKGKIDFYPGMKFNSTRARYAYFSPNGLSYKKVALSLQPLDELYQLKEIRIGVPLGGGVIEGFSLPIASKNIEIDKLDIEKAIHLFKRKRFDLVLIDNYEAQCYLSGKPQLLEKIYLHEDCCGTEQSYHLGFSMASPLFSSQPNIKYQPLKPISIENFPIIVDKKSVAFHFMHAVMELAKSGEAKKIYNYWSSCDKPPPKVINVWTYYRTPPFSIEDDKHDLTSILFHIMSINSKGKWRFKPQYLPRKRINYLLNEGQQGIVVWANPSWFDDREKTKYYWTQRVVSGRNEIVSLNSAPVNYTGPHSLFGMRFGGVLGHNYVDIDKYASSENILRIDTTSFNENVTKLLKRRLDVTLVPRSKLFFILNERNIHDKVYISPVPHQIYSRKFLVTDELVEVRDYLNEQLDAFENTEFDTLLERYGLQR